MRLVSSQQIAVVIASTRRETRLAFALDALLEQTLAPDRFEVVVVRGAHDAGRTVPPAGLNVRVIDHRAAGPAELRNVGWRATKAPLVAFTDDDCRPTPDWLDQLLASAAGRSDGFFVQGATHPDPDELHLMYGLARTQLIDSASGWYETCNMLYPRALLEGLDGFDEEFKGGRGGPEGGEDTDLALRALRAGARFEFAPAARVVHAVHQRHAWQAVRDARRWGTIARLIQRYPEQRRELRHGIFWKPQHERFLLAACGVASRRPALAAAGAAPYIRHHLGRYDSTPRGAARALLDLPARVAADTAEVAVTLAAAARERVLVL